MKRNQIDCTEIFFFNQLNSLIYVKKQGLELNEQYPNALNEGIQTNISDNSAPPDLLNEYFLLILQVNTRRVKPPTHSPI